MEGEAIASVETALATAAWHLERLGESRTWREPFSHWINSYPSASIDSRAIDATPDLCWRCDARSAADAIGLCPPCRADLTS